MKSMTTYEKLHRKINGSTNYNFIFCDLYKKNMGQFS